MGRELQSPRELGVNIPEGADKAIMHAMNMKPDERYVSMRLFEEDIEHASADEKKAFVNADPVIQYPFQAAMPYSMMPKVQMPPMITPYPGINGYGFNQNVIHVPNPVSQKPVYPNYPSMQYISISASQAPLPGTGGGSDQNQEPGFFEWTFRYFKKKLKKVLKKIKKK